MIAIYSFEFHCEAYPHSPGSGYKQCIPWISAICIMTTFDNNSIFIDPAKPTWDSIRWKVVDQQVKHLRYRIFNASKSKKYKKLRNLQKLTCNSLCVVIHAVRKVTAISRGKGTSGLDQQVYLTNDKRLQLALKIHNMNLKDWQPSQVKRVYIPKPDGRKRPLGIPNVIDRAIQAVIVTALEPEWEAKFESISYGFRPGKSYQDAVHRIFTLMTKKDRIWILDADISCCFDEINHNYLMSCISKFPFSDLILKWLKAGFMENGISYDVDMGTPQGGVISPLLANIALHGIEADLGITYNSQGYISRRNNPLSRTLIRYADDFIIICPSKNVAEQSIVDVNNALTKRGLALSDPKTRITTTFDGFDFLGFHFQHRIKLGYKNINLGDFSNGVHPSLTNYVSTLVSPSKKSLKSFKAKLSTTFRDHRGKSVDKLITKINRMIRGYCESKRTHSFSKAASSIDNHLFKLQMRWVKRAHPKKSTDWCVKRYFMHLKTLRINNKWTFHDPGSPLVCYHAKWYSSRRIWPPVQNKLSPDDPSTKEYWDKRINNLFTCKSVDLTSSFDYSLATSQNGMCPVCEQSLLEGSKLHRHHIVPTSEGGKNSLGNLVLIHLHCHHHIHYGGVFDFWLETLGAYKTQLSSKKETFKWVPSGLNSFDDI